MSNQDTVREYLGAMFGGHSDFDRARALLADDLDYEGPMLTAKDADDFIGQMRAIAARVPAMKAEIRHVISDGELVAALYELGSPHPVLFAEWFKVVDGRIAAIAIVHDTRPYAGMQG